MHIPKLLSTARLSELQGLNLDREVAERLRSLLPAITGCSSQAALKELHFSRKLPAARLIQGVSFRSFVRDRMLVPKCNPLKAKEVCFLQRA